MKFWNRNSVSFKSNRSNVNNNRAIIKGEGFDNKILISYLRRLNNTWRVETKISISSTIKGGIAAKEESYIDNH